MSGKQLFDTLVWAWEQHQKTRPYSHWERAKADGFLMPTPPAWPFLSSKEQGAFNQAAKSLTPEEVVT